MRPFQFPEMPVIVLQLVGAALLVAYGVGGLSQIAEARPAHNVAVAQTAGSLAPTGSAAASSSLLQRERRQAAKSNKKTKAFELECLVAHNKWRRLHGANELSFDKKITAFAQKRADFIAASDGDEFRHPNDLPYGENLAWHSRPTTSCSDLIKMWYDEVDLYDFRRAQFDHETGHFTQLVWRNTERVGCARAYSGGPKGGIYLVCNYDPPGNFLGEALENVLTRRKPLAPVVPQPPVKPTTTTTTTTIRSTTALAPTPAPPQVVSTTSVALITSTTTTAAPSTTTAKPSAEKRDKNEDGKKKNKGNKKNKKKGKKGKKNKNKNNKKNKNNNKKKSNNKPPTTPTTTQQPPPVSGNPIAATTNTSRNQ